MKIPFIKVRQSITLPEGDSVAVYDIQTAPASIERSERLRNVFRLAPDGTPLWRISLFAAADIRAYQEVYRSADGRLLAYNADSWEYEVDLETGTVLRPHAFLK